MNERSPKEKPRLVLIMGGRMEQQREEAKRRAEIREFIAACERLYEKNRQRFEFHFFHTALFLLIRLNPI